VRSRSESPVSNTAHSTCTKAVRVRESGRQHDTTHSHIVWGTRTEAPLEPLVYGLRPSALVHRTNATKQRRARRPRTESLTHTPKTPPVRPSPPRHIAHWPSLTHTHGARGIGRRRLAHHCHSAPPPPAVASSSRRLLLQSPPVSSSCCLLVLSSSSLCCATFLRSDPLCTRPSSPHQRRGSTRHADCTC